MVSLLAASRAISIDIPYSHARVLVAPGDVASSWKTLSAVSDRATIIRMPTTSRPQQRYDHRLRDLVRRTGDLTIATDLGVPRSTARGWLRATARVVVTLELADLTEPELRQEIRKLRRRVEKLAALLRLALALLHASGFRLSGELPDGPAKRRILRAVDRARGCLPSRGVLRFLGLSPGRLQAWRQRHTACALDDQSSCPRTSPHRLTRAEIQAIGDMVTSAGTPTSRPAPWPSSRSASARCPRHGRRGAASYARMAGGVRDCECIPQSRRWDCVRRAQTRCRTSTRRSSVCSTAHVPISMR
jgi:hypothetical protein